MKTGNNKIQLKNFSLEELNGYLESLDEPKFRAKQIFNWIYNHLSSDFEEMLNLPKSLREKLSVNCDLQTLKLKTAKDSPITGTKKYLFSTRDGKNIETVVIPEGERNTLCISTQVGCPLDCKFCATGLMGFKRNLETGEIVDQYLLTAKEYGKNKITNIVYMGMGEPLLNYDAAIKSLSIFTNEFSVGLSRNRITLSTAGIPKRIKKFADSGIRIKLALSLHSCFDGIRSEIMPINKKYPLRENLEAVKYYAAKTKTRITFEYTMLKGINDRIEDIKALTKLCGRIRAKINLIPFNSISHMDPYGISAKLESTPYQEFLKFVESLRQNKITVMVRETQGDDIAAACGQLAVRFK